MVDPTPGVDTLTVLHAPGHAPDMTDAVIERAEATGADVVNYTEAYKLAGASLHGRRGYRTFVGRSGTNTRLVTSPRGDAGDNPICTSTRLRRCRQQALRITRPGPAGRLFKFTPERWLTLVTVEWEGQLVTVINVHPSPYFAGPLKWRRVMQAAIRQVHAAKARGEAVVLTGDLQTGRATALLREAGLQVFASGIDYVAWFGLVRVTGSVFKVAPLDHPWILTTFRAA